MQSIAEALKTYTLSHPFPAGSCSSETILDQLYQSYTESRQPDSPEISNGFNELESFLKPLPLEDNNAVFNLRCRLCTVSSRKMAGRIWSQSSDMKSG